MFRYVILLIATVVAVSVETFGAVGSVIVGEGAKLEGTGTISANVTFESGSTCTVDVAANDPLDVSGDLVLGGATLDLGDTELTAAVTLITSSSSVTGTFDGLAHEAPIQTNEYIYYIGYLNDGVNSEVFITKSSSPTSSGIDLRAYQGADGVYVEFVAFDVENDGEIKLALLDEKGAIAWQGVVSAISGPEFVARFKVPGLLVGQAYDFKVRDEVGTWWTASGVNVGGFSAEMVSMTLSGATIAFDSIAGREYDVQWTASLSDEWQTVNTVVAEGPITNVEVAFPEAGQPAGFFRARIH